MPNIYVTDETKESIEKAAKLDERTQDGEINFLCKQRIKELSAPSEVKPSSVVNDKDSTKSDNPCQERK